MGYSEMIVILLVYSGMIIYFLIPFQSDKDVVNKRESQLKITRVFKDSVIDIILHKKAVSALILFSFTLFCIWSTYDTAEYHVNNHSGYPPISMDLKAFYSMGGVLVYTIVLTFFLAFLRTLKIVKGERQVYKELYEVFIPH